MSPTIVTIQRSDAALYDPSNLQKNVVNNWNLIWVDMSG